MPLEAVMSKYYGESERLLGAVFSQANELSDGAIIFLDEVKSILFLSRFDSEFNKKLTCLSNVSDRCLCYIS